VARRKNLAAQLVGGHLPLADRLPPTDLLLLTVNRRHPGRSLVANFDQQRHSGGAARRQVKVALADRRSAV